ncbi:hypothetical protein AVEN_243840-1 [Araneus ventricosus]|uniref:DUF4371 domain-containing protein n=1 Tax=Araneus ventricosus TaxID=182803 RepID=A0A4Y2A731_ARAVE|nr:hypothetical protein AVEN_243840-1 [Araneus ventricosus]
MDFQRGSKSKLSTAALQFSSDFHIDDRFWSGANEFVLCGMIVNVHLSSHQWPRPNPSRRRYFLSSEWRAELCNKSDKFTLQGLYLDGRKDDTLVVELAHSKRFRRVKKEEHYSLYIIQEPGSVYIGHVTPTSGSSEDIVTSIISYLSGRGISLEKLVVIGYDGTAVNTGWKNGLIRRIEIHLGKPLQWVVCLLHHFNELPFRHLFQYLEDKSTVNL